MKLLLGIILLLIISCSCRTTRQIVEIPIETIRTDYIVDLKVDSIFERDSVDRYISGDTVFIYREHTKYKYKLKVDTFIKKDTIPKIIKVEAVKEVEVNHIKWYQRILMYTGGIGFVLLLVVGTHKLTKLKIL